MAITSWFITLLFIFISIVGCLPQNTAEPWFDRVFIVVLENQPLDVAMQYDHMVDLVSRGTLLTDFYAIINPSQPNYIAMTAGDLMGVRTNDDVDVAGDSIVDLLEAKGISWKSYQENYPGNCFSGSASSDMLYRRKHNPFISYNHVRDNAALCSKIVNADELHYDISNDSIPQYMFYTPNMNHNGHDTDMGYAAAWLSSFIRPLLRNPTFMKRTLVVITFDEGKEDDNRIFTLLLGDDVDQGYIDTTEYTHYSLLATIEDVFGLSSLNRSDISAARIVRSNAMQGKYIPPLLSMTQMVVLAILAILAIPGFVLLFILLRRYQRKRIAKAKVAYTELPMLSESV